MLGEERELELGRTLARAGHPVILVTSGRVDESGELRVIRIPALPPAPRAILEALVMQSLVVEIARQRQVPIEEFVFSNPDTKVDPVGAHDAG